MFMTNCSDILIVCFCMASISSTQRKLCEGHTVFITFTTESTLCTAPSMEEVFNMLYFKMLYFFLFKKNVKWNCLGIKESFDFNPPLPDSKAHALSCPSCCLLAGETQPRPQWCGLFPEFVLEAWWRVIRHVILIRQWWVKLGPYLLTVQQSAWHRVGVQWMTNEWTDDPWGTLGFLIWANGQRYHLLRWRGERRDLLAGGEG